MLWDVSGWSVFVHVWVFHASACDEWSLLPKPDLHRDVNRFGHSAVVSNGWVSSSDGLKHTGQMLKPQSFHNHLLVFQQTNILCCWSWRCDYEWYHLLNINDDQNTDDGIKHFSCGCLTNQVFYFLLGYFCPILKNCIKLWMFFSLFCPLL